MPNGRTAPIEVLNKADLLGGVAEVEVRPGNVAVSAITGEGLDALRARSTRASPRAWSWPNTRSRRAMAPGSPGSTSMARWSSASDGESAIHVAVRLLPADRARFEREQGRAD